MIPRQVCAVVMFDHSPAHLVHAAHTEQLPGGNATEQHNQGRIDQLNLRKEIERGTGVGFAFSGWTVVFRTAFHRIGNKKVAALDAAAGQYFIQKAPGGTDERLATLIFLPARGFTNEHHACRGRTLPWDGPGPCGMQRTLYTTPNLCGQCFQSFSFS